MKRSSKFTIWNMEEVGNRMPGSSTQKVFPWQPLRRPLPRNASKLGRKSRSSLSKLSGPTDFSSPSSHASRPKSNFTSGSAKPYQSMVTSGRLHKCRRHSYPSCGYGYPVESPEQVFLECSRHVRDRPDPSLVIQLWACIVYAAGGQVTQSRGRLPRVLCRTKLTTFGPPTFSLWRSCSFRPLLPRENRLSPLTLYIFRLMGFQTRRNQIG